MQGDREGLGDAGSSTGRGPDADTEREIQRLVGLIRDTQARLTALAGEETDAVLDATGTPVWLHRAHEHFVRNATRQAAILDALPAQLALLDGAGRIVAVNAAWRTFASENAFQGSDFGVGQSYLEVCDRAAGPCAEEAPAAVEGLRAVLEGRAPGFELEYPCHSPTQSRWFQMRVTPIDPTGQQGAVVMHIDVTERRQAAERLAEQAALLDQASDAILVRDLEHRVRFWNKGAEAIYGWTAEQARGRLVHELLYDDAESFHVATAAVLREGAWKGELEHVSKDGAAIAVFGRWTLVRDDAGRPRGILALNTDITQRKRLEQQVLRVQRMESIGRLAGGLAHDLNNVMAPILISLEILQSRLPDADSQSLLQTLHDSAQRGAGLIRQILAFARGVEGKRALVHPAEIAREIQGLARETFPKNIRFIVEAAPDVWAVEADATQLHQVLMNLCVNARDAMPEGGELRVAVENAVIDEVYAGMHEEARPGPYVVFRVEDSGHGMTKEVQDRLFEPFFTTKEFGRGLGLGLPTIYGIVRDHGGFVTVYSEVGKGTRFDAYLPANPERRAAEEVAVLRTHLPRGRGEVILLVDDEEAIRDVARRALERFGYRVLVAANGAEAISVYVRHRAQIDAVLTDMSMPVMDGPAMIVALRAIDPGVRIVGSSGLGAQGLVAKAAGAGVEHFVPKPYTAETLLTTLREILDAPGPGASASAPTVDATTPATPGAATARAAPPAAERPAPAATPARRTILVVEDSAPLARLAQHVLEPHGYEVLTAGTVDEALALLAARATPIDLVFTDVHLPVKDGFALVREVEARYPSTKILLTSGDDARLRGAAGEGASRRPSLRKPYSIEQLEEAVAELLRA